MRFPAAAAPFSRGPAPRVASQIISLPAPTRGLVLNDNVAAADPLGARVLINWYPTQTGVRVRRGATRHATVGSPTAVVSMLGYRSASAAKMFACTASAIYDVTSPSDANVSPSAAVSSLTGGYWSGAQIATSGGEFLIAANGADAVRSFDGSAWATPSLTGVTSANVNYPFVHKSRLWLLINNSLVAYYLPSGSIAGTVADLNLQGVVKRGGRLLFGSTVSSDSGDGMDDRLILVTSEGEMAVYAGTDPSDAAAWALEGVFYLGSRPLGRKAHTRVGGDVLIATEAGVVSALMAMQTDPASLSKTAVSAAIEPEWRRQVAERPASTLPWEMARADALGWAIVSCPTTATAERRNFALNLSTQAWTFWTGWDCRCFAELDGLVYAGTGGGRVLRLENGGLDDGATYECRLATAANHLGAMSYYKALHMVRATFLASSAFLPLVSLGRDYEPVFPPAPAVAPTTGGSFWGSAVFGSSVWGSATPRTVTTQWRSVERNARAATLQAQVSIGSVATPDVELAAFDALFDVGGSVV